MVIAELKIFDRETLTCTAPCLTQHRNANAISYLIRFQLGETHFLVTSFDSQCLFALPGSLILFVEVKECTGYPQFAVEKLSSELKWKQEFARRDKVCGPGWGTGGTHRQRIMNLLGELRREL